MDYFPLFLRLQGKPVLLVGAGEVARRKLVLLRAAGAVVTVVAPDLSGIAAEYGDDAQVSLRQQAFAPEQLHGKWLVIAATNDPSVNAAVAHAAEAQQIWANVVDDTEQCSAIVPAIVDRSPVVIAISSGATAPVLARRIRAQLEALIDESVGTLAKLAQRWRETIKTRLPDVSARRRFWDAVLDSRLPTLLKNRRQQDAEQLLSDLLAQAETPQQRGHVSLVGAGPGDPGLLTLNAQRALQQADVIFYDQLVSPAVLELARRDAELISVGKKAGNHKTSQAAINTLLVEHARQNKRVVRLKGGDPFIFGRGGEELEALAAEHISFDVVPGITAAIACAAYAGIPLTHRSHAQSVRFVTAHCQNSADTLDWANLAREQQTLAFYMGVAQLETIRTKLLEHGAAPTLPFAMIENGSRPEQRVITGHLSELPEQARKHQVQSPALLVIGDVAQLHHRLQWFNPETVRSENTQPERSVA